MNSLKSSFTKGFTKTAGLPKWLHEMPATKAKIKGESKIGLKGLLKRRGSLIGAVGG